MRNVQRIASCGDAIANERSREEDNCRSNEVKSGAATSTVATQVAFNSDPDALLARGWETGAVFLVEVAQQVLFAQHFGRHAFSAELARMQDRAERLIGVVRSAIAIANETVILLSIELFCSTT